MVTAVRPQVRYRISIRQITEEIRPLIDTVSSLILEIDDPPLYYESYHKLCQLIANDDVWETINHVQEGAASNYALHNLGADRVEWLRDFREKITKKAVK